MGIYRLTQLLLSSKYWLEDNNSYVRRYIPTYYIHGYEYDVLVE
jgi:hypothetical protein